MNKSHAAALGILSKVKFLVGRQFVDAQNRHGIILAFSMNHSYLECSVKFGQENYATITWREFKKSCKLVPEKKTKQRKKKPEKKHFSQSLKLNVS